MAQGRDAASWIERGCALAVSLLIASSASAQLDGGLPSDAAPVEEPEEQVEAPEEPPAEPAQEEEVEEESEPEHEARDHDAPIRYTLERIEIRGNTRTDTGVVRNYVPLQD